MTGEIIVRGDVRLNGADCAEEFLGETDTVTDPGTVMVIAADERLRECVEPYDTKVAGVLSGAGSYRPGLILGQQPSTEFPLRLALVGKVYCKVDAQYAPIAVGDLLTSSSTPGHAMKAADPYRAFGAILGKALRPLPHGCGVIPVLVALQ